MIHVKITQSSKHGSFSKKNSISFSVNKNIKNNELINTIDNDFNESESKLFLKNFPKKPTIISNIENYINKLQGVFKEKFSDSMKKISEIYRNKYEEKIKLSIENLIYSKECDLIFNGEYGKNFYIIF